MAEPSIQRKSNDDRGSLEEIRKFCADFFLLYPMLIFFLSFYSKPQMSLLLKSGHKINKPIPLFTKIEQTRVDELKAKYGGVQQPAVKETKVEKSKFFSTIEEAEKAVADQGEKVRKLKSGGVEKSVWQPEVNILLELKKQLESLKTQTAEKSAPAAAAAPSADDIKKVEAEIAEQVRLIDAMREKVFSSLMKFLTFFSHFSQGNKVRQLKTSGADKSTVQKEVEALLALKNKLVALTGKPIEQPSSDSKKNKKKK